MKNLVFASNNQHKVSEVRTKLAHLPNGASWNIISLADISCFDDIPEPFETLDENANAKAAFVLQNYGVDCFADDTGLEVKALDGRPGVYSARYAGEACSYEDNVRKLLVEMKDITDRSACFRTVICLLLNGQSHYFEGRVEGKIIETPRGEEGFGYDPVFVPDAYDLTFAELPLSEKNKISHRALALEKLMAFLSTVE